MEEIMLDIMYEIPSQTEPAECVITKKVVVNRVKPELTFKPKGKEEKLA
jgi:ATP-dependent Clp protease ATP-binding subunit ClpX